MEKSRDLAGHEYYCHWQSEGWKYMIYQFIFKVIKVLKIL